MKAILKHEDAAALGDAKCSSALTAETTRSHCCCACGARFGFCHPTSFATFPVSSGGASGRSYLSQEQAQSPRRRRNRRIGCCRPKKHQNSAQNWLNLPVQGRSMNLWLQFPVSQFVCACKQFDVFHSHGSDSWCVRSNSLQHLQSIVLIGSLCIVLDTGSMCRHCHCLMNGFWREASGGGDPGDANCNRLAERGGTLIPKSHISI